MIEFILLCIALLVIVIWLIAPVLLGNQTQNPANRQQLNIAIARERLAELDAQLQQGDIDQAHYDQASDEINLALLDEANAPEATQQETIQPNTLQTELPGNYRRNIFILLTLMPFLAFALYQYWGAPEAISGLGQTEPVQSQAPAAASDNQPQHAGNMGEMLARLESRLAQDPNDPDGWYTLARSYMVLKQYAKAESAFRQLRSLIGDQANILLGLADAMTMTRNGDMRGEPFELAKRALELEPENPTALWLTGIGYRDHGDRVTAVSLWKKLLPLISSDPQSVHEVRNLIQQAEAQLDGKLASESQPTAAITATTINPPALTASITVRVELAPESTNNFSATDVVMVFAQRSTGMKMPLAMYKAQVKDLPMTITLSDDLALSPMNKLSSADQVKLVARISKSGQAIKQPGDIEVVSGPHSVADTDRITLSFPP